VNRRAVGNWVWGEGDCLLEELAEVWARDLPHFDCPALFSHAKFSPTIAPPVGDYFDWYVLPLFIAGLVAIATRFRSRAMQVLLCVTLLYPAGDVLNQGESLNPL